MDSPKDDKRILAFGSPPGPLVRTLRGRPLHEWNLWGFLLFIHHIGHSWNGLMPQKGKVLHPVIKVDFYPFKMENHQFKLTINLFKLRLCEVENHHLKFPKINYIRMGILRVNVPSNQFWESRKVNNKLPNNKLHEGMDWRIAEYCAAES